MYNWVEVFERKLLVRRACILLDDPVKWTRWQKGSIFLERFCEQTLHQFYSQSILVHALSYASSIPIDISSSYLKNIFKKPTEN